MARTARLVTADAEQPVREAALFLAVMFLLWTVGFLPLLASDRGWIAISVPAGVQVFGLLSPGLAAIVVQAYDDGLAGVRSVFGGLTAWRFGRVWWGVTLALPPVFALVLAGGVIVLGNDFSPTPVQVVAEAGPAFVLLILLVSVVGVSEEIGWRGHLLPLLQARLSALSASLALGVIWAVWHIPLFFGFEGWILPLRLVALFGAAVMYTWLFNNTGGSLLAVVVLHIGTNLWGRLLGPIPSTQPAAAVFTVENILLGAVLVVIFGGTTLTDRRRLPGR